MTRLNLASTTTPTIPGCGREKAARQGVLSALPPEPPSPGRAGGDGRFAVAWLHITAPYGAIPTGHSWCACGRDRSAVGKPRVLALIDTHTAHRDLCPLRTTQEGATAA